MEKISNFIVKYRNKILIFAILLLIPSALGFIGTGINYDLLSYLPQEAESMKAQEILGDDFNLSSVDFLVVNGMKDKDVAELKQEVKKVDGVEKVYWRDDVLPITIPKETLPKSVRSMLYSDDATMMIVTFKEGTASDRTMNAISNIKKIASKKCFLAGMSALSEDTKDMINHDMPIFSLIAIVLVLFVLWFGLESNFAPFVFMLGIGFPIAYNFGTNIVLGVLSTIFILPSLLMIFDKQIEKKKHKVLIRPLKKVPAKIINHYKAILLVFAIAFIPVWYASNHTNVYYDLISNMPQTFNSVIGTNQLKEKFDMTTTNFVLVDDSVSTKDVQEMCNKIEDLDGIHNVLAYETAVGPGIPSSFEPSAIKEILNNNGRRLIVVNSDYRAARDNLNKQLDQMDDIIHQYDKHAVIGGEGKLTEDLIHTCQKDFKMVNAVSMILIFIIIAITFKSIALPIILVATIEFAININMGIPYVTGSVLPFIAPIVIGTIQLGATVDYAILMTSRFKEELEKGKHCKHAIGSAIKHTSTSIITSGLSFFAACIGVSFVAEMDLLKSICILLARGALISVVAILVVLPTLLLVFHKVIEKTTKGWPVATVEKGMITNEDE